ncbi:MAG: hypothetical protein AAF390_01560 [Pseudomonadota bacterium]
MWNDQEMFAYPTTYQKERAHFAELKRNLQHRKRAGWRLRLALLVAGRRGPRRQGFKGRTDGSVTVFPAMRRTEC